MQAAVRRLVQQMEHPIIESLDMVLLLLTNLRLGFDNVPELDNVILNLLNVDWTRNLVGTHHLSNGIFGHINILLIPMCLDPAHAYDGVQNCK